MLCQQTAFHVPAIAKELTRRNSLGDPKDLATFYHVSTLDFEAALKAEEAEEKAEKKSLVVEDNETPETFVIQPKKQMSILDFCRN